MKINLNMDIGRLVLRLEKGERRLGFAAINTVNESAKDVQKAQQDALLGKMTVRRPDFTLRNIAVIVFASVKRERPFAEVFIGKKPRLLLAEFEKGGEKEHKGKNVAIPVTGEEARPTFRTAQDFPPLVRRLKFKRPRGKRRPGAKVVLQGEGGRFLIPNRGIYRRTATGVRAVVVYKPRVRIPATLGWMDRAERVGRRAMREHMEREAIKAFARSGAR